MINGRLFGVSCGVGLFVAFLAGVNCIHVEADSPELLLMAERARNFSRKAVAEPAVPSEHCPQYTSCSRQHKTRCPQYTSCSDPLEPRCPQYSSCKIEQKSRCPQYSSCSVEENKDRTVPDSAEGRLLERLRNMERAVEHKLPATDKAPCPQYSSCSYEHGGALASNVNLLPGLMSAHV